MDTLTLYVIVRDDYEESVGLFSDLRTAMAEAKELEGTWVPVPLSVLGSHEKDDPKHQDPGHLGHGYL